MSSQAVDVSEPIRMSCGSKLLLTITAFGIGTIVYSWVTNYFPYFKRYDLVGQVKSLCVFPVASGQCMDCSSAVCTTAGLSSFGLYNKQFFIVKEINALGKKTEVHGSPSQGALILFNSGKMKLIEVYTDGVDVLLAAPNMKNIRVKSEKYSKGEILGKAKHLLRQLKCGSSILVGYDMGDEVANWLTKFLEVESLRLIRTSHEATQETGGRNSYGNFIICTEESVHLAKKHMYIQPSIDTHYFRSNIVLKGCYPFEETKWEEILIGDKVRLRITGSDTRILSTALDDTVARAVQYLDEPPLSLLGIRVFNGLYTTRTIGVNAKVIREGEIKTGDPVFAFRTAKFVPSLGF